MSHVIEMLNIRKEFPGIVANDDITLQVEKGEIHAILGENGAGKSTLMSILFGLYHADKGIIKVRGKEVRITNPNDANDLGIGMVHQHFQLVQNFTVTENIILGKEGHFVLDRKGAGKKIKALSEQYGLKIDPSSVIEDITVGMQQRVEILKMLYRDAEILIFDEPTAVLTPQEIEELMQIMKNMIKEGKSVLLITHKLDEIKAVANRCTIIRRGKMVGVVDVATTTQAEMASMMVGRPVNFKVDKQPMKTGDTVLEVSHLNVFNAKKYFAVKDFSLKISRGEIVGIAGVDGNGQSELVEAITGLRPIESGYINFNGEKFTHLSIRERNEAGLGHIPEDRQKTGLVLDFTIAENLIIKECTQEPYVKKGVLQYPEINKHAAEMISKYNIKAPSGDVKVKTLSGGNQQKVVIARELDAQPVLDIASHPTRGLDLGAVAGVHDILLKERERDAAVLFISAELQEVMALSDRIIVLYSGKIMGILDGETADQFTIGQMMLGQAMEVTHEK